MALDLWGLPSKLPGLQSDHEKDTSQNPTETRHKTPAQLSQAVQAPQTREV